MSGVWKAGWHDACVRQRAMTTTFSYRLAQGDEGYVASCHELSMEAMASSPEGAVCALRSALERHLASVEAVAPPSRPAASLHVQLVAALEHDMEPDGPGDAPAPAAVQ
jgi:hypothetical protein